MNEGLIETFKVRLVSPKKAAILREASKVSVYAKDGFMEIYPDHAPIVSALGNGILTIFDEDFPDGDMIALFGGFLHFRDNELILIAPHLEIPDDIDVERAQEALHRAHQRIGGMGQSITQGKVDVERALSSKIRSILRLKLKGVEVDE